MKKYNAHNSLLPFYLAHQFQVDDSNNRYNLCFSYHLHNEGQATLLINKVQELIKLKAYLRQTFELVQDKIIACIHDELPAHIHFFTSTIANLNNLENTLTTVRHDLSKTSSIRLNIIKITDDNSCIGFFNIHHILMDGYSLQQFISDLNQLIAGECVVHESAKVYLAQLKNELLLQEETNHLEITQYLQTVHDIANNMTYTDINTQSDALYFTQILPNSLKQKLIKASKLHGLSIFNLLLLAWSVFIAQLNNSKNTLVNYPVNIRSDKIISGCFINMVIMPLTLTTEDTYLNLICFLKEKINFFKYLSRFELRNCLNVGPISSFAYSDFAKLKCLIIDGESFSCKCYPQIANSNLSIKYKEENGTFLFSMDILSDLFPECVTSTLLPRFFNFCNKLLDNPRHLLSNFDLTFTREKKKILTEFNQPIQYFPQRKTIIDLFEEQVKKTPGRTALVFENIRLTYTELNEKANQLAHYLKNHHQVKPDDLIALLLERNEHTLIAILAVLKTGGAYVPLDFSYPSERIEYILDDTQVKMILINEIHRDKLIPLLNHQDYKFKSILNKVDIIAIDSRETQKELAEFESSDIITADTCANLAYVIYTSGTTGKPKGVMVEHKSVLNTLSALNQVYKKHHDSDSPLKITAFTSYAFDVSVSEFFVPLLRGDELHLLSNHSRRDILATSQYINNHQINYVYLPPVLLANLPRIKYPSLEAIIYAGESCDSKTALYWSNKIKLYNYYGPTETSIYTTGLQIKTDEVNLIGKPITNTTAYVLNTEYKLLPVGIIGELYIGGCGLAKGYLNLREITEERFISNPFQTDEEKLQGVNSRLYKTGDLVRWCSNGYIEYIGRNDFQVKIRGYRIELGEIENALASFPDIKQAAVLVKNFIDAQDSLTSHKFLVGYYVTEEEINERKIQEYLALHLPDYMQPSALVHLTHFPLTTNGKLDKNLLPTPELIRANHYIPPTNEKETLVCKAFAKILGLAKVGIEDDFFKLGGNSILAISLVTTLQTNFSVNVMDIFNLKTPKKIARDILFIKDNLKNNLEKIRSDYQTRSHLSFSEAPFQTKLDTYFQAIRQLKIITTKTSINHVLLTGATGFLGCNLLNTLLMTTDYSIFLLIRANSDQEAYERVNKKFQFYFEKNLHHFYNKRIFVYAGDIEKKDLNITKETYQMLITQIDSIIHSAALTKHYGEYDTFYLANVQATGNLLELCKLTKLKYFHYISTTSVLNEGFVPNCDHYIFTEDDEGDNLEIRTNIYVKTKYEGEKMVIKYRQHGILGNIYRVGNLAFMASNYQAQENIEDNGFFTRLKCLINLKMVAPEISLEEISPVDLTAQAIIKLFDREELTNCIFHVFNPTIYNLADLLSQEETFNVKKVTINQFIATIMNELNNPDYNHSIELFLLHRRWLNEQPSYATQIRILQDRTQAVLRALGFEWASLAHEAVSNYLKKGIYCAKQSNHT